MKIFVIHGSMRKGNTYALTQEVIKNLKIYENIEITEISAADLKLDFCKSCSLCFLKGEEYCPHAGIAGKVRTELDNAEGIILSGAVYSMGLNAAMKNIIDHLSYLFHRPALFGKKGIAVATTAGAGDKSVAKYLQSVMGHWGINGVQIITHKAQSVDFRLTDKEKIKIKKITEKFYNDIKSGREIKPSVESIAVHNAFRAMASASSPVSERDAGYWKSGGFADKVYPMKTGLINRIIGSLTYNIMKGFFK